MRKILLFLFCIFITACSENTEKVVSGTLTMGHEVRAFIEDGQNKEYWIIDKSGDLYKQYLQIAPIEQGAYVPINAEIKVKELPKMAEIKVKELPKMEDGFGAEYDGTYEVLEIISLYPTKQ